MKNRRKKAAALSYEYYKDSAPKIIAKGTDSLAEKIIQIARENNIPIKEDVKLVEVLSTLELYQEIPSELYRAVAEILAFIYWVTEGNKQEFMLK
ncbi:MAG: EscU/YscU/HrcU family type III secretion system export apparatus switch protein [Nitrospirae bacterium]|jgi:flagellar biosynthesis protein|nr:EscU/YscU/HrcU family type III secretion system export apparatus switch protein [Nitrospirota bacterium]